MFSCQTVLPFCALLVYLDCMLYEVIGVQKKKNSVDL